MYNWSMKTSKVEGTILTERLTAGTTKGNEEGSFTRERIAGWEANGVVVDCTLRGVLWCRVGWDGQIDWAMFDDGKVWSSR